MDEEQFLRAVTVNYYSSVFYASSVWYQNAKAIHKTKFNSIHFRILRTATRSFGASRPELSKRCQRATPIEWARFVTASRVIKTIRDEEPKSLFELLHSTYFEESRKPFIGMFFDDSKTLLGRQSIQNRLMFMRCITDPWNNKNQKLSDDQVRVITKSAFFDYYTEKVVGIVTNVINN